MEKEITFGAWLRQRRRQLDLTQTALAERMGYSVVTIRKLERDETRPSKQLAERLAQSLELATGQQADIITFARFPTAASSPAPSTVEMLPIQNTSRSKLPPQLTPFFGRTAEQLELGQLLQEPASRLLTLVGPGGIGKTRLALEVAQAQMARNADGVYFVPLAPLRSPDHILPAIAEAISFQFQVDNRPPQEQLTGYLRQKQLLLILDNFEHLLDGVGLIQELLQVCPTLRLLVTSRERLRLSSETVFTLDGMDFPHGVTVQEMLTYSAVQLFVTTARRTHPKFLLNNANAEDIVQICRLVGGMPLAIILAAAWVEVLSPAEIATELSQGFGLLKAELRDLPDRHQSMSAVLSQAWQRLSEDERLVFMRLALFRGGFTRQAAQSVASASLHTLSAMVSKSLLQCDVKGRYTIHELLRQYGMEQLETSGDLLGVQAGHAEYFATWAEHARQQLWGNEQSKWIKQIEVEHDNLRAGLAWGLANRATELVLRMTLPLQAFWTWRAYDLEMNQWFDQIFALVDQRWGTFEANEINELDDSQRQQLTLYADALLARAESLPFAVAEELYHRCLALDQQIGPTINTIIVYDCLADGARDRGDYALAETWHRTAAETVPTLQLTEHELLNQNAFVAYRWSENALAQGHLEQCAALAQQAAMLFDQLENQRFATYCRYQFALSVLHGDEPKQALPLLEHCFSCFQEMGATDASSWVKCALGHHFLYIGELADAHAAFIESIRLMPQSSRFGNLLGLAGLSNQLGNYPRAATLLGALEKIRAEEGYVIHPVSQPQLTATLAATRAHLDDSTFDTAWSMGCQMTRDEVVAFALAEHA